MSSNQRPGKMPYRGIGVDNHRPLNGSPNSGGMPMNGLGKPIAKPHKGKGLMSGVDKMIKGAQKGKGVSQVQWSVIQKHEMRPNAGSKAGPSF